MGATQTIEGKEATTLVEQRIKELGLTYERVAARIAVVTNGLIAPDQSLVWRWAKASSRPSEKNLKALSLALDLDMNEIRSDIESRYRERRTRAPNSKPQPPSPLSQLQEAEENIEIETIMKRRSFLKAGVGLVAASATGYPDDRLSDDLLGLAAAAGKSHVSRATLAALETVTNHYAFNMWTYDYRQLSADINKYLRQLTELLNSPLTCGERAEVCLRGSELSLILGLVCFEIGAHQQSRANLSNSFYLAREIDHKGLMSYVASLESLHFAASGQNRDGALLTDAASRFASGTTLVDVASNNALLWARAKDKLAAKESIRKVEYLIDQTYSGNEVSSFWMFPKNVALLRVAHSWIQLGEPTLALRAAEYSSVEVHNNAVSELGQAKLAMAMSFAQLRDAHRASGLVMEVLSQEPQNRYLFESQTMEVLGYLAGCDSPKISELQGALREYLKLSSGDHLD